MKTPPPKLKLCAQNPASPFTPTDPETLLPFGKAAKSIFVKANGLPAYYKSLGGFRYTP